MFHLEGDEDDMDIGGGKLQCNAGQHSRTVQYGSACSALDLPRFEDGNTSQGVQ